MVSMIHFCRCVWEDPHFLFVWIETSTAKQPAADATSTDNNFDAFTLIDQRIHFNDVIFFVALIKVTVFLEFWILKQKLSRLPFDLVGGIRTNSQPG